jgi:hypothetical protein
MVPEALETAALRVIEQAPSWLSVDMPLTHIESIFHVPTMSPPHAGELHVPSLVAVPLHAKTDVAAAAAIASPPHMLTRIRELLWSRRRIHAAFARSR